MAFTNEDYLPSVKELTVPELELTSGVLRAGAHHLGKYCDNQCKEFMLCRIENKDPRKCLSEGKEVTRCSFEFFGKVKAHCFKSFTNYYECVDVSDRQMSLKNCRKTQMEFDKCMKTQLCQDRPWIGYFSSPRLHHTDRPKPKLLPHELPERLPDPPDFCQEPKHQFGPDRL